ncbi:MAG TPA: F0F1 ATP synthase subunit B, partial [Phototrophicaceae bacterium]|nr:F0F1 ATP synthase subunit B [Phototrophicaceae bacterium]
VFGLLTVALWNPVTKALDSRAAKTQKGLEDAAAAAAARRNAEAEAEKVLAAARQEAASLVEQGRARGEEAAKAVQSDARTAADKIRTDAGNEAKTLRDAELANLRGQVANISVAIARRLIGDSLMDKGKQDALINDFFTKAPAEAKNLSGKVEVVSAMPLDASEQGKVKTQIGASDVTFTVDPGILGGLVIRAGDRVIDGSIRSGLSNVSGRLN